MLNERERRIFEKRRLADEKITLAELAEEFGVTRERVRQIEVRAFEKVQNSLNRLLKNRLRQTTMSNIRNPKIAKGTRRHKSEGLPRLRARASVGICRPSANL